ncbi:spermidine synthase family protein [Actinokineospora iranica]|nr:spermidine synthase [Actinokineospora iranica]
MRAPKIIDRADGACGDLVLRRAADHYEIIADGMFLMDTRAGQSERLLVRAAASRMPGGRVLIGGLGVGFSLREALSLPRVSEVVVVEREPAVIRWNHGPLGNADALTDPRTHCVEADLVAWLAATDTRFDALCLDIDNGPDWTLSPDNASLYSADGLALLARRRTPGGVLSIWSANASASFLSRLRSTFQHVEVLEVPVPRGEPDVVYLAT